MAYFTVGDDGLILRLGGKATVNDKTYAPGVRREKYDGSKDLNGIARTRLASEDFTRVIAVGDDGVALIRSRSTGEWSRKLTGTGRDLNAVSFAPGTKTAWAVGDEGTILRTQDGGHNWSLESSGTTRHLRAVFAVDAGHAWAAGDEGVIRKTNDGGSTWLAQPQTVSKHLHGICRGPDVVLAVGDDATLVIRHAGTWHEVRVHTKDFQAVAMSSGGHVLVVGDDGVIKTRVPGGWGGNELGFWTVQPGISTKHLRGAVAIDDTHMAIVGDREFLTSTDGGGSWQRHGAGTMNAVC